MEAIKWFSFSGSWKHAAHIGYLLGIIALMPLLGASCSAQQTWKAAIAPDNAFNLKFHNEAGRIFHLEIVGWGPNWGWRSFGKAGHATNGTLKVSAPFEANKDAGEVIQVAMEVSQPDSKSLQLRYTLTAEQDVPLTLLSAVITTDELYKKGKAIVTQSEGGDAITLPLALNLTSSTPPVSKVLFRPDQGSPVTLQLSPAVPLGIDQGLRVVLAKDKFSRGTRTVTLTFRFPQPIRFYASKSDLASLTSTLAGPDWYPFQPKNDLGPSALGFENWLEKPAGKHGIVQIVRGHLAFADGTPVKFWGTNLQYGASAPSKSDAEFTAKRFAKWGVNAVRMHKFTNSGWEGIGDPNDAIKMEAAGLDRLDYFAHQLTQNGIYYGWSHTFGLRPMPGNRAQLLAYDEIMNSLEGNTYSLINCAEDVQDLMIARVVNLLRHKNPYTGLTYAQDPALCFIELQNEDDIFFYTTSDVLQKCPTYRKHFSDRWNEWLKQRYGSEAALQKAWGDALKSDENWDANSIGLETNPWFFGNDNLPKTKDGSRRRLLDNALFLHEFQDRFYKRFAAAIRAAGYKGPLIGSPWQAPTLLPHLYNLKSDAEIGIVDRHNYFGGGLNDTTLEKPGSGNLSSGLQQVLGKPFGMSEWIHVYPTVYSAEGPVIFAAYGLGLQGWDASYEFSSNSGPTAFTELAGNFPYGVWNVDVPSQIGQFPLLARLVQRGDVKEGEVISVHRVSDADLANGEFNFSETVTQNADVKSFAGQTQPEALAAGRCLVEFIRTSAPSIFPDMTRYRMGTAIRSNTGQLDWDTAGQGFITINTPGTKALVGFAEGKDFMLGEITLTSKSAFASLILTAAEKGKDLSNCRSALISAVARTCNTGFRYSTLNDKVLENGKEPILLEPVKATISVHGRDIQAVYLLDHDGRRTEKQLTVRNGSFSIDGSSDHTPYYEVIFHP